MHLKAVSHRLLRSVRDEQDGFTMITVLGAMLAVMLMSAVAIATATSDLGGGARDKATKQALQAAEAGVNDYTYHLTANNNYWTLCTDVPSPAIVNQANAATKQWRALPGTNSQYAIELLPANGKASCDKANAAGSMIDTATGTFRIRVTGRVPVGRDSANNVTYAERKLVANYRRKGFLDFLYFTNYETSDPAVYRVDTGGRATRNNSSDTGTTRLTDWASSRCPTYYRNGRSSLSWSGQINASSGTWVNKTADCNEIQFADNDVVSGPLHTNDSLLVCGSPTFGRSRADSIETEATADATGGAWRQRCSGTPNFVGTLRPGANHVEPPATNSELKTIADDAYSFTGATQIQLNGSANTMTVTNTSMGISNKTMSVPSNGVIYVDDGACGAQYDPLSPSAPASAPGCGNAFIKGSYSKDLTIAAKSDVVVQGNVTRTNDSVLGLIANQFVRVAHPVTVPSPATSVDDSGNASAPCTNNTSDANWNNDIEIDAAILALNHSFIVDRYFCGAPIGTLTVDGVIAQQFRGAVGTGGSAGIATGYVKNYKYDTRLNLRQPPYFLDPVQSAWRLARQTEQTR